MQNSNASNKTSITPQSPLRRIDLINKTNQAWLYQTNLSSTNHVRVHATHDREHVIIVLHSVEVVHVPHGSWSSLIAGYPLYWWVPIQTSGVCARTSLQGCSMVFPSLHHTHITPRGLGPGSPRRTAPVQCYLIRSKHKQSINKMQ
jgi:hypothetical protein